MSNNIFLTFRYYFSISEIKWIGLSEADPSISGFVIHEILFSILFFFFP